MVRWLQNSELGSMWKKMVVTGHLPGWSEKDLKNVRKASLRADNLTLDLTNTKQKCNCTHLTATVGEVTAIKQEMFFTK
jgi:uncharacterized HAD superfamily protein